MKRQLVDGVIGGSLQSSGCIGKQGCEATQLPASLARVVTWVTQLVVHRLLHFTTFTKPKLLPAVVTAVPRNQYCLILDMIKWLMDSWHS